MISSNIPTRQLPSPRLPITACIPCGLPIFTAYMSAAVRTPRNVPDTSVRLKYLHTVHKSNGTHVSLKSQPPTQLPSPRSPIHTLTLSELPIFTASMRADVRSPRPTRS